MFFFFPDNETIINKFVWNHVAHNNFTTHENLHQQYCLHSLCAECCSNIFLIPYYVFCGKKLLQKKKELTAWAPCVSRLAFAFETIPVIVRDAVFLFSTRKAFWFTSTLLSYTIRKREDKMCHKWPERFLLLNCANPSFLPFVQIKARNDHPIPLDNNDIMSCGMMQQKKG